ncbi:MAG: hypothetical protein BWY69_01689 [Planctomycetes bacterium ADurb.Bin401]|nr:MAG: hypothetical protein BWY69_01689 [Planctomycetes bacterium ADurb.Bin401]
MEKKNKGFETKRLSIGFKIGVIAALLHLGLAVYAFSTYINSCSSTASLVFIIFFFLDAPFLLLPRDIFTVFGKASPLILYGFFGSMMWFFIPYLIDKIVVFPFPKTIKAVRAVIVLAAIGLIFWGFKNSTHFLISHSIKQERPSELKKSLNKESSGFLSENIIFDSNQFSLISIINLAAENKNQSIISLRNQVIFIDENFKEQRRINFGNSGFISIQPFTFDANDTLRFLAHKNNEGVYVFDQNGNELWNFTQKSKHSISIDGAGLGDVDGDGKKEVVLFFRYTNGITLLDSSGNIKWTHPVIAIGKVEMADVDNDGAEEIIYTNSNNASGKTSFEILNGKGESIKKLEVATKSYEFALIKWQSEAYNILLTEENKIRIINLNGEAVISLDAPGCREYGNVQTAIVKFANNQKPYLAVKKKLHPDLLVLYVYDYNGKLVYQKSEVYEFGSFNPPLIVKKDNQTNNEKLVTGSIRDNRAMILEYRLAQ